MFDEFSRYGPAEPELVYMVGISGTTVGEMVGF